jgi:hypothetical protein
MTELSPAAQAVLDAFRTSHAGPGCLAAALRAAVACTKDCPVRDVWQCDADELLAIADELEAQ